MLCAPQKFCEQTLLKTSSNRGNEVDFPSFFSTILREIYCIMKSIIVITNCEKSSPLIKEHFEKLLEKLKNYDFSPTLLLGNDPKTNNLQEDYVFASKTVDCQQELNSAFYLHSKDILDNFLKPQL